MSGIEAEAEPPRKRSVGRRIVRTLLWVFALLVVLALLMSAGMAFVPACESSISPSWMDLDRRKPRIGMCLVRKDPS